jgi:hypothetical protein
LFLDANAPVTLLFVDPESNAWLVWGEMKAGSSATFIFILFLPEKECLMLYAAHYSGREKSCRDNIETGVIEQNVASNLVVVFSDRICQWCFSVAGKRG